MGSIKKNFIYNIIYQMLVLILPLITTPYISRVFGAENIGIYSYTYSVAYYFVLIAMLGVNNYGNRSCARVRDEREKLSQTFWSIYFLQLILSVICTLSYLIYALLIVKNNFIITLLQTFYVISTAFDINWFFFSLEKFKVTIARNLFVKLFTILMIFLMVKSKNSLCIYTAIMSLGTLLSQLVVWPFLKSEVDFYTPKAKEMLGHLKPNLILFVPAVAVSLYKYMDKIMIGLMSDMSQEGYFAQAEKILQIPLGIISALGTVMLPRMSNIAEKYDIKESVKLIDKSMLFISFLAPALAFGLAGISSTFIPLFLGDGYTLCINILTGLSLSVLPVAWANIIRTQYLIPYKKDTVYLYTVALGAVVNFIVNGLLIGSLGAMGAVVGTVFAEMSVAISQTFMVRKALPVTKYLKDFTPFFIAGAVMFVILRKVDFGANPYVELLGKIGLGAGFYTAVSFVIMEISHKGVLNELANGFRKKEKML
ncbi:flippase [Lacrimispora celerecrescens]|uniref:Polysaccharide biosynthesis protein n=1 Tax=Lacrimispora celerecrescens TaxID=29354 RepID=A0A084JQG9_9FIRM|nr:flippase [Lacrimispora celerecrescens]KEZ91203.1 polysaccharide biosynthesis protein [Lacrimispora celerecrescens]